MNKTRISLVLILFLVWLSITGLRPLSPNPRSFSSSIAAPAAPDPFGKWLPDNRDNNRPVELTLSWHASATPNVTYEYCLRTNKGGQCPPPKWISVGTNTSVALQGLTPNTTYYWQVRAYDTPGDYTYADGESTWWQFSTVRLDNFPGAFSKLTPADAAENQPVSGLALTWSASNLATSYQYCYDTVNNNTCDGAWTSTTALTASLSGLTNGVLYYWQVRAVNITGSVQADYGTWWSFRTQLAAPGEFGKSSPANGVAGQPLNLTLSWGASAGGDITYAYCVDIAACTPSSTWTPAGTNLSAQPAGLQYETTYYWQVRAVNATATVYADSNTSWSFTTPIPPPGNFNKTSPGDTLSNQPLNLTLTWGASTGTITRYEYCYGITACTPASTWYLAGMNTSASISGLAYGTTYYWQVRAVNATGPTYADGKVWQFTTQAMPPQAFNKLSPAMGSTDRVPVDLILQWSASAGASGYFFCVDTASHPAGDTACSSPGWVSNATTASNHLNLSYNQTYYWQVYAVNSQGNFYADAGAWGSFTTVQVAPGPLDFTKISPMIDAINQPLQPWLYWWYPTTPPPAPGTTYQVCIYTGAACPDANWMDVLTVNAPIQVTTPLANNTTYSWQMRASSGGETKYANDNTAWTFTTLKAPPTSSDQPYSTDENTLLARTLPGTSNYGKVFELFGSRPAGALDFHSDGSFTYTPVQYYNGVVTFQFILSDGYNAPTAPYTVSITVNPVNNAPALNPIPDQKVKNGSQLTFYAQASDPDLPYGEALVYSVDETLPAGASINPVSGLFTWNVPANQASGVFNFTIRVTDSKGLSATRIVRIEVVTPGILYMPVLSRNHK